MISWGLENTTLARVSSMEVEWGGVKGKKRWMKKGAIEPSG